MLRRGAVLAALASGAVGGPASNAFLPPMASTYAADADLVPASVVADPDACAQRCTDYGSGCVSFNLCATGVAGSFRCGISGWNVSYVLAQAQGCSYYRRTFPRNDTKVVQAVPWLLNVPAPRTVHLNGGPIADAFQVNIDTYLHVRSPLDMLYWFAERAGQQPPNGSQCFGWDGWIPGSATGNYLMGAGNALQWTDDALLAANVAAVVQGMRQYAQPNGWVFAFPEANITWDNLPDYCAGWVTRGLLAADGAGVPDALDLAREQISLFNNHSALPAFLPPNGGPNPVQPFPSGFNNVTSGGYGQPTGHMIYIQYQGIIKHTLLALSRAGTQADVDIVANQYQEDWWLAALIARDPFHAIWHRTFFSHNYEVTAYEAYLDMYVLTGNATYLDAMLGAWDMLRAQWIHVGGSFAINEGSYYPPSSYYIGFTGTHVSAHSHSHDGHSHGESDDPYFHSKCMFKPSAEEDSASGITEYRSPLQRLKAAAMEPAPGGTGPNDSNPPTGELCGSVFWTLFNQRFHRLFPENETFVWEMERSVINVGLAALGRPGSGGEGPQGTGIRYFANLHKQKQYPSQHASCCEGQGTRLYGLLPSLLYTVAHEGGAVYVDLFAESNITFPLAGAAQGQNAVLTQNTAWPYGTSVSLTLSLPVAATVDVAIRVPAWLAAASMPVTVNGASGQYVGTPGSYLHVKQAWPAGDSTLSFDLPMALTAHAYNGSSALPPYARYAYTYGPVLLALEGPWNATVDALVMPAGLNPATPTAWLQPAADGNALHFEVAGTNGAFKALPYFEIQADGEMFDVYPCFAA